MLMPSIFSRDFMDDLFDMPQRTYAKSYSANGLMKTDIKESEEGFTVEKMCIRDSLTEGQRK